MDALTWADVDRAARAAQRPLPDPWLEARNENGEPYRRFLHLLAAALRPAVAVELGVDRAQTTAHLAAAVAPRGGRVYGFDNRPPPAQGREVEARWPGAVRLLWCDSLGGPEALRRLGVREVGLVFQDSAHHGEHSRCEWERWEPLLAPGAAWVCHDVSAAFRMGDEPFGMEDYWAWLPGRKRLYSLTPGNGIGVLLRDGER